MTPRDITLTIAFPAVTQVCHGDCLLLWGPNNDRRPFGTFDVWNDLPRLSLIVSGTEFGPTA